MAQDVPSPINLKSMADAQTWAAEASARPGRTEMLLRFVSELSAAGAKSVLELGSGPGFLTDLILRSIPDVSYSALDNSVAMHILANERLGRRATSVAWIERDFREPDWPSGLAKFDAIVTNQAVHEVRHKSRALGLHAAVRGLLKENGAYLLCDHWCGPGGMANSELYLTVEEQADALAQAGFKSVDLLSVVGTLAFFRARMAAM